MKATLAGELLLLVGLLAVAYLLYVQQEQLVSLELEVDRLRGAFNPVPVAQQDGSGLGEGMAPTPKPKRKASGA